MQVKGREYKNYRKPSSNPGSRSLYGTECVGNLRLLDENKYQTHDLGGCGQERNLICPSCHLYSKEKLGFRVPTIPRVVLQRTSINLVYETNRASSKGKR